MNLQKLSGAALILVVATSLFFSVKFGSTPVMKLVLFLLGLSIWYGILTFVRELVGKPGKGV